MSNCPNKQSDSDPIRSQLGFSRNVHMFLSLQSLTSSTSLVSFTFHHILGESVISPLLKKSTLDKDELSNYHPISNLSVISKIIERVVKSRLIDHLTYNKLLNPHQSAYCRHHSTETALLYIHDHLINAIGSQKVSCLFYISTAFDTIDHNILITRLSSWFGIHGSVLSWLKSYLSSRSLSVITISHIFILPLCVFPRGSVLGPLLFIMYTTPLNSLISSLSLGHHLYTDDTQLFFSFRPLNLDSSISHLENAFQQISSWMTTNLLTLNSFKT